MPALSMDIRRPNRGIRFAHDSLVEGDGLEPSVPHEKGLVLGSPRSNARAKPTIASRDDPSRWLPEALAMKSQQAVEHVEQFQRYLAARPRPSAQC
jgi:hypothetical protein